MERHERYMRRCFDLARLGLQTASPNPIVGSVIVHEDEIIGEGFHFRRGEAHAEVNAFDSVPDSQRHLIPKSTIYVSLEPCSHHGLTPPCSDRIIQEGIRNVVISVTDPNPLVAGRGVARLRNAEIDVVTGVLEHEGRHVMSAFMSSMENSRPFVILKYVQSSDHFIGKEDRQVWLSNTYEKILVHKIRSEVDAIMVGTNTAVIDNPQLNTREYFGPHPLRVIVDRSLRVPRSHYINDGQVPTLIFSEESNGDMPAEVVQISFDDQLLPRCLEELQKRDVQSILVEGGAKLLSSFIEKDLWDEAWVVTTKHRLGSGVKAPLLQGKLRGRHVIDTDILHVISNGRQPNRS